MERIYGIKQGNNQHNEDSNNVGKLTQEDLLKRLGLNKETYRQAKSLANLSPEIQQLIEQGTISASTAARVIGSKLPKEEQTAATYTVKKSVTPTEYNNSNKEIRCYTLTQILDFKQFAI